jgi:hypothetical protein
VKGKRQRDNNRERKQSQQKAAAKFFKLTSRTDEADVLGGFKVQVFHQGPKPDQGEPHEASVYVTWKRFVGEIGKLIRKAVCERLNEPVKKRSEQGASDENRNDVNEQRSQRSHGGDDRKQSMGTQSGLGGIDEVIQMGRQ